MPPINDITNAIQLDPFQIAYLRGSQLLTATWRIWFAGGSLFSFGNVAAGAGSGFYRPSGGAFNQEVRTNLAQSGVGLSQYIAVRNSGLNHYNSAVANGAPPLFFQDFVSGNNQAFLGIYASFTTRTYESSDPNEPMLPGEVATPVLEGWRRAWGAVAFEGFYTPWLRQTFGEIAIPAPELLSIVPADEWTPPW